ncbi:uncharacterized protein E0L32_004770 [Thyridium curvatum]|uniref:Uncharacterized protein n=1 Tax=Thyridium curvatum TaxID=1093900 RepID=A0A507AYZ7_9PEZI|nr:uncharacterized protein E0L32_004770 [Thyridium curvatum]TPX15212.1 hypothetical protein E0L32_004770 [Thyridium curvatum]
MSASERSPLLAGTEDQSASASRSEITPLLSRADGAGGYDAGLPRDHDSASSIRSRASRTSSKTAEKSSRRWPSIIAIVTLALISVGIIIGAFFVPAALEEYTKEAAVIEPTNLSLQSISAKGVHARIQGNIRADASRVKNAHVRRLGRTLAWVFRRLGSDGRTTFRCYLPEYDNMLLGTAEIPPMVLTIVDNYNNKVDFVAELVPGDPEVVRVIANDWLKGRLTRLRLNGVGDVQLRTWFLPLGTVTLSDSMVFEGQDLYRSFASLYFGEKFLS